MKRTTKPTFQSFSYPLRPAKNVERKMLSEACRRLSFFEAVENYRYIGFGSTTFTDFILFHKHLGIRDMYSIEDQEDFKLRFEFNKPYQCINMRYGLSSEMLEEFDWDKRTIVWLDYESGLTDIVLNDISLVCMKGKSGTALIVTVNVAGNTYQLPQKLRSASKEEQDAYRLNAFTKAIGKPKVPGDIHGKNLEGGELAGTYRQIVMNEIDQTLRNRNGFVDETHRMQYAPLFNFRYKDGARMMTVGGVLYENKDEAVLKQCNFESLDFVKPGAEPFTIEMPILTQRERRHLDSLLPAGMLEDLDIGLTKDEIANYQRVYRYFPSFIEVELA